jgi:nucleoside-diphosphate-sugar epimerase
MMKKALVTGATGFIGSNLTWRLIHDGWEVHVVVRSLTSLNELAELAASVSIHRHDGSTENLVKIMEVAAPDIVFHLASLFIAQHAVQDIEKLITSNLLFSTQLAEAMSVNDITCLINTGTSWQHYENEAYNSVCLYAATKQAFEDILEYYVKAQRLKVITLKLFDTFGPRDVRPKLYNLLEKTSKSSTPLAMSLGEQLIDIVYVDDVIDAYLVAAKRIMSHLPETHEKYGISSGDPISLRTFVEIYEDVKKIELAIQWGARPYRNREVMVPWTNYQTIPGWQPKISIRDGMRRIASAG